MHKPENHVDSWEREHVGASALGHCLWAVGRWGEVRALGKQMPHHHLERPAPGAHTCPSTVCRTSNLPGSQASPLGRSSTASDYDECPGTSANLAFGGHSPEGTIPPNILMQIWCKLLHWAVADDWVETSSSSEVSVLTNDFRSTTFSFL